MTGTWHVLLGSSGVRQETVLVFRSWTTKEDSSDDTGRLALLRCQTETEG